MTDTAADDDASTRCPNCGQGIPTANFAMHELHCARNLTRCSHPGCTSVFPATEEEDHMDDFHALRFCECGARMENQFYDRHRTSECSMRLIPCLFCGMPVALFDLLEHEDFCGSRTELCTACGEYVLFRDLEVHISTNCAFNTLKEGREAAAAASAAGSSGTGDGGEAGQGTSATPGSVVFGADGEEISDTETFLRTLASVCYTNEDAWRDDGSIARARATLDAALGTWQEKYMSWVEHTGLMVGPLSTASREEQLEYMMFQLSRQVVSDHPRLRAESGRMIVKLLDAMPWESSHLVARGLARMAPGLKAVLKDTLVPRLVSGVDARTALGFVSGEERREGVMSLQECARAAVLRSWAVCGEGVYTSLSREMVTYVTAEDEGRLECLRLTTDLLGRLRQDTESLLADVLRPLFAAVVRNLGHPRSDIRAATVAALGALTPFLSDMMVVQYMNRVKEILAVGEGEVETAIESLDVIASTNPAVLQKHMADVLPLVSDYALHGGAANPVEIVAYCETLANSAFEHCGEAESISSKLGPTMGAVMKDHPHFIRTVLAHHTRSPSPYVRGTVCGVVRYLTPELIEAESEAMLAIAGLVNDDDRDVRACALGAVRVLAANADILPGDFTANLVADVVTQCTKSPEEDEGFTRMSRAFKKKKYVNYAKANAEAFETLLGFVHAGTTRDVGLVAPALVTGIDLGNALEADFMAQKFAMRKASLMMLAILADAAGGEALAPHVGPLAAVLAPMFGETYTVDSAIHKHRKILKATRSVAAGVQRCLADGSEAAAEWGAFLESLPPAPITE